MPVRPTLSSDRLRGKAGPSATTESGRPARPPIEPASQSPAAKLPPAASPAADPDSSEQPPRSGAATGTSPTDSSTIGVTDVRRVWPEVLAAVQRRRRATQILLESATVVGVESGVLQVAMPSAGMARRVMETANADLLRAALREILGVDWTIRCQAVGGSPHAAGPPRGATGGPPSASPARGGSGGPAAEPIPPPPDPEPDEEIPDDYGEPPDPSATPAVVRDPEETAIALLSSELGARRLDPPA